MKKRMGSQKALDKLSGADRRSVTPAVAARMRAGDLREISANVVKVALKGGPSFSIVDQRYALAGLIWGVFSLIPHKKLFVHPKSASCPPPDAPHALLFRPNKLPPPRCPERFGCDRYMKLLPPAVRLCYPFDLYGQGGATHRPLDKTMICGQSVSSMTRELQQMYAHEQMQRMLKYCMWTQLEGGTWPPWVPAGDGAWVSAPTNANIEAYSEARYQQVRKTRK